MKIKKTIIIVIGVLFVLDLYCAVLGRLHLTVINKKGEPIKGVRVTLQSTKISTSVYKITTDKKGLAIQIGLRNHVFVVTLEKQGYRKYQTHIKIPAGLVQKEIITLKTNEEVIEEQEAKDPHAQAINNFNKAVPLIKEKKYEEALVFLKKSIALDDTIIQSYYYLGVCYYEMEENEAAIEPLKKVIELKEDHTQAYRLLAAAYEKLDNKEESKKYTELARKIGGATALDLYNEGVTALNANDIDKAIRSFEEVIKKDDKFADAYYQLGMNYLNKGLNDKAIGCFKKYIELQPNGKYAEIARSVLNTLE